MGVSGRGEVGVGNASGEDGEDGGGQWSVPSCRGCGGEEDHPLHQKEARRKEGRKKEGRKKGRRRKGEEREKKRYPWCV